MNQEHKKRKRFLPVVIILMLCILVFGFSGCGATNSQEEKTKRTPENYTQNTEKSEEENVQANSQRVGEEKLDNFSSIEVHVQSPDIRLERGEDYSVRYHLHSMEKLATLEVQNGVLRMETVMDSQWAPDDDRREIIITVPKRAKLEKVELHTAAGEVLLEDFEIPSVNLSSASKRVEAKNVQSETMILHSTANKVLATDCSAKTLRADSASGDVLLQGEFTDVEAETASGACKLSGKVTGNVKLKTVSGDIFFAAPLGSVSAESYRGITLDNVQKGNSFSMGKENPTVHLKSVTGTITIETKK